MGWAANGLEQGTSKVKEVSSCEMWRKESEVSDEVMRVKRLILGALLAYKGMQIRDIG
jgi:hypothetical protein